jgi:hypothetical protein
VKTRDKEGGRKERRGTVSQGAAAWWSLFSTEKFVRWMVKALVIAHFTTATTLSEMTGMGGYGH